MREGAAYSVAMLPSYRDARTGDMKKVHATRGGWCSCCSSITSFTKAIFKTKESRSIFYFLLLNLSFAFVELS